MSKTFFLIDDEANSQASVIGYAEELVLASEGTLKIEVHRPGSIQEVLEFIAAAKPDGLLVDVAFTNALAGDGAPVPYDGIALAQQIRTLQTRGLRQGGASLPEFPLIRCAKTDVILEYITGDTTSDDLFDEKIDKADIVDNPRPAAKKAFSLAADYPELITYARSEPTDEALANLLGSSTEFLPRIDARALLGLRRSGAPAHVLSRYLTGTLFGRPGPLINDTLLAVRLGVDHNSSTDWPALQEMLKGCAYTGVFAGGYVRWWMALIIDWWGERIGTEQAVFRLNAVDRVNAIRRKTGLENLKPYPEDPDSPGTKFWHRCILSGRPVDPSFGFPLMPEWGQESWQDVDYLCLEEAKRNPRNSRLGPAERTRIAKLLKVDALR